jgi:iron complex outermembrane receptor protein
VQISKMLLRCLTVAYAMLASALATATVNDEIHVSIAENNEAAGAASAQDSDRATASSQNSSVEIGEIVVTATKRSQSINSVGMTITAATGDTLVERGITSTSDLVRVTPGLNYTPSPYQEPVYVLRGVGLYESGLASSPAVTVYVDQIPLTSPIMTEVSPLDLERVEVLYGPQGTLFGQNSTGGAINYVTAKPTSSYQSGANLTYERFNKISANARLAVGAVSGGAWQYSQTRPGDQLGDTRVFQGRLLLDWHPSDRLEFEFGVTGFYDNSDTNAHQLVKAVPSFPTLASRQLLAAPIASNDPRAADWPAGIGLRSKDPFFQISVRTDYTLTSDITLTALTSYQDVKQDKLSDLSGIDGPTGAESLGGPSFLAHALGRVESFNQEIRLLGKQGPFIWTAGAYFDYMHIDDALLFTTNDTNDMPIPSIGAFEFPAGRTITDVNDYAVFGNLDFQLNEHFTAHVMPTLACMTGILQETPPRYRISLRHCKRSLPRSVQKRHRLSR